MRVRIRIFIVFSWIILFNTSGYSQLFPVLGAQRVEDNLLFIPQGYMLPNLSGYGYSKTIGDVSNIGNMNPAALSSFNSISGGISYQYDSKINEAWIADIGYYKNKNAMPQSAGFVYPYRDFRFGVGFTQKMNRSLDEGKWYISTIEHPEGTGEYFIPISDYNIYSSSITAAWSTHNTLVKGDKLSFGLRYELNMLNIYEEIWTIKAKGLFYNSSFALGVTYDGLSIDNYTYKLSFFFEKGANLNGNLAINGGGVTQISTDMLNGGRPANYVPISFITIGQTPDRLNAGFDFNVSEPLRLSTNFTYVYWNAIDIHTNNNAEFLISALYSLSDRISFSLGTFYAQYNNPEIQVFQEGDILNAAYLTAGTVIHFGLTDINIGIADSHLMSGEWRKQTVGMVAFGFHL
jgi:hypothetical protein